MLAGRPTATYIHILLHGGLGDREGSQVMEGVVSLELGGCNALSQLCCPSISTFILKNTTVIIETLELQLFLILFLPIHKEH